MQGSSTVRLGSPTPRIARTSVAIALMAGMLLAMGGVASASGERTSRLTDEVVFDPNAVPPRPWRLELGDAFVGTGNISKGWELPTGAVWTPSLLIWGSYRTALQAFEGGNDEDVNCGKGPRTRRTPTRVGDPDRPDALRPQGDVYQRGVSGTP